MYDVIDHILQHRVAHCSQKQPLDFPRRELRACEFVVLVDTVPLLTHGGEGTPACGESTAAPLVTRGGRATGSNRGAVAEVVHDVEKQRNVKLGQIAAVDPGSGGVSGGVRLSGVCTGAADPVEGGERRLRLK